MATIKSYTDLSQSETLSKILPLESADGGWYGTDNPFAANNTFWLHTKYSNEAAFPAWSLTALLNVLPKGNMLVKTNDGEYYCLAKEVMTAHYKNPIDACVDMIKLLHEQKLL